MAEKNFNFVKNTVIPDLSNPCDSAVLSKTFRAAKLPPWKILERDAVDEFIFITENSRNRLMLELMARGVMRIGEVLKLKPHDLRRYAATYASRSGVPIEIVSKIILRHSNLSTTQRYLGKVNDTEAMHWIENIYR